MLTEHIGDAALSELGEVGDDKKIHDRDLAWLIEADYLVAEVTTPSLGVGYESAGAGLERAGVAADDEAQEARERDRHE